MNEDANLYSQYHGMQQRDSKLFMTKYVPMMQWNDNSDVVMDIGCGPGNITRRTLLPSIPEVESIIAVDVLPSMIKFAKEQNSHPKISYYVADIGDKSTLEKWDGKITKIISLYCIHWLQDQETAFKNIYDLLREGGEAILLFTLSTLFWNSYSDLVNSPKWRQYLQDVNPHVPESHFKNYGNSYFREMLEKIGFSVLACEQEKRLFSYVNDEAARESAASRCAFTSHIPFQLKEDFKDDLFKSFVKYSGRDEVGKPELKQATLSLHLKKHL